MPSGELRFIGFARRGLVAQERNQPATRAPLHGSPRSSRCPRTRKRVIDPADQQSPGGGLLLEMALEAEGLVPFREQLVVHRPVDRVAGGASFAHGLVLEHKRPALGGVAPAAGLVDSGEGRSHAAHARPFVRIVAVAAAQLAFQHGMMKRQVELAALVQVTIKTDLRRAVRIDDVPSTAARFDVDAAGAVTRFAADLDRVGPFGPQVGVRRGFEWFGDRLVALRARVGADELGALDVRWSDQRAGRA